MPRDSFPGLPACLGDVLWVFAMPAVICKRLITTVPFTVGTEYLSAHNDRSGGRARAWSRAAWVPAPAPPRAALVGSVSSLRLSVPSCEMGVLIVPTASRPHSAP